MRPRKPTNKLLPPNLYMLKKGKRYYFSYRNPKTGKFNGMGSDRQKAVNAANQLNSKLTRHSPDLVARVLSDGYTLSDWLTRYNDILRDRELAPRTLHERQLQIKRIDAALGHYQLEDIDTGMVADFIDGISDAGKKRAAQVFRSLLIDLFDEAIRKGKRADNPVRVTRNPVAKVKRERLTLDVFNAILEKTDTLQPWVANSMLLALVTGQRREDISAMRFADVRDGWLHVKQHKTGTLLRLSTDLRLDSVNMSIADVIKRCRDRVLSRHLIHHTRNFRTYKAGRPVQPVALSHGFQQARELTGLSWGHPPTFHELRSLAGRLYKQQGIDPQALLGHKDATMTNRYLDARGAEWLEIKASF